MLWDSVSYFQLNGSQRWRLLSFSWYRKIIQHEDYSPSPMFITPCVSRVSPVLFHDPCCARYLSLSTLYHTSSLAFFSARLCVARISPSVVRSERFYGWAVHPHTLINSWGASPPTNLMENPFQGQRVALVFEKVKTSMVLAQWNLTQPF